MADDTVVPKIEALDEERFHATMMEAINRQIVRHGRAKVAGVMCLSLKQLENVGKGAFPRIDRVHNLRSLDADALDPIDREYGERRVPRTAICSTDPISTKLAELLAKTIDMEREDSCSGPSVSLRELRMLDEDTLRRTAHALAGWVEMLDEYRSGTSTPKLRAVGE